MARILDKVFGHQKNIEILLKARGQDQVTNQLPSAMLFVGREGVGKLQVALGIAQSLVCDVSSGACGKCGPCLRIEEKQSESLFFVEPEKSLIKVEKSREILEFLSLQKIGKARVVIINDAHALNPQASNVLLKILEEPPPASYFIFVTHRPNQLLPTIRSRTQMFRFKGLTSAELKKLCAAPEWAYLASGGSASSLLDLLDVDSQERRHRAAEIFEQLLTNHEYFYETSWREHIRDREAAKEIFRHWVSFIRDASLHSLVPHSTINVDQPNILQALESIRPNQLSKMRENVLDLESALMAHRDPVLVAEEFLIKTLHSH